MANLNNGGNSEPNSAPQPGRWYNLSLGSSFKDNPSTKFCTLRYEFKPASIDKSQAGSLHKNKDNRVTVEFSNNQPGKPKVSFEGSSEDYKENDGALFFDGETFRLERLHRAVKRLRHVRMPGESAAIAAAVATTSTSVNPAAAIGLGVETRSPSLVRMGKSHPMPKAVVHSVPLWPNLPADLASICQSRQIDLLHLRTRSMKWRKASICFLETRTMKCQMKLMQRLQLGLTCICQTRMTVMMKLLMWMSATMRVIRGQMLLKLCVLK